MAELAASLVALTAVFLGVLFVTAIGLENIGVTIGARSDADQNSAAGIVSGDEGKSILEWDLGADQLQFTADDQPIGATSGFEGDPAYFSDKLNSGDYYARLESFGLTGDLHYAPEDIYRLEDASKEGTGLYSILPQSNFASSIQTSDFFLGAADLSGTTKSESDPLGQRKLTALSGAFKALIADGDITLHDSVYMPTWIK